MSGFIEVKRIDSLDLPRPKLPPDPANCCILVEAQIGPKGSEASELFRFEVVTCSYLAENPIARWGRGLLLLPEFSWAHVDRMVARVVAGARGTDWGSSARNLSRTLDWEFDGYVPHAPAS
ncbi:Imm8 family immunity protein [Pseudomarimonas salicorniae]|uniref:Imm8 family immunity protein n=1 Tax=Pseudomarimonas salicorniae TaxID=2933270 RepID=UPI003CCCBCA6